MLLVDFRCIVVRLEPVFRQADAFLRQLRGQRCAGIIRKSRALPDFPKQCAEQNERLRPVEIGVKLTAAEAQPVIRVEPGVPAPVARRQGLRRGVLIGKRTEPEEILGSVLRENRIFRGGFAVRHGQNEIGKAFFS